MTMSSYDKTARATVALCCVTYMIVRMTMGYPDHALAREGVVLRNDVHKLRQH